MGIIRSVGIVILVILLTINLTAANVAVGADRTVLNPGFVTSTLADEDVYESLLSVTETQLAGMTQSGNGSFEQLPISPEAIFAQSVTPAYLRGQTEANVERNLAYLHGNRDEPNISIDLRPVKENVTAAIAAELQNVTVAELLGMFSGANATDSNQLSMTLLVEMSESERAYEAARQTFRSDIRDQVVNAMVDEHVSAATNDELLALVIDDYDPDAYTDEEKSTMVDERSTEIRIESRALIEADAGDEIDEQIASELSAYREEIRSGALAEIEGVADEMGPETSGALRDLVAVGVDGLTTDMTYEEYRTQLEAAKDRFALALAERFGEELDKNVPDRFDLTAEMDQAALDGFAQARQAVQLVDVLAIGLPAFALVLVGLVWLLSRSLVTTLFGPGVASLLAGGAGVAAGSVGPDMLRTQIPTAVGADPGMQTGVDITLALVDQVADAFVFQSGLLLGCGVLLIGLAVAFKTGTLTVDLFTGLVDRE